MAAGVAGLVAILATAGPAAAAPLEAFRSVLASLRVEALAQGLPAATVDAALGGLAPDPAVAAMTVRQPEFAKPTGAYLAAQVTDGRLAAGREAMRRWATPLAAAERRSGVPAAILVAVWGLESNYGTAGGSKDVIRSMATLAAAGYRVDLYRAELLAALACLADGSARRADLRGSWAGAMGQPQFMPSSFRALAVDGDGDGRRDIWGSVPDVLASIGNFLLAKGWQAGEPWGLPVTVPAGVDPGDSRAPFAAWAALGVRRTDGGALPAAGTGILLYPSGIAGPAFLVTGNYEVIKSYNFSDAYVLSVGTLADRLEGGAPQKLPWPATVGLSKAQRIDLQARLAAHGLDVDNREGRISLALRDTIRQAQRAAGLVPDGNPTQALLDALR